MSKSNSNRIKWNPSWDSVVLILILFFFHLFRCSAVVVESVTTPETFCNFKAVLLKAWILLLLEVVNATFLRVCVIMNTENANPQYRFDQRIFTVDSIVSIKIVFFHHLSLHKTHTQIPIYTVISIDLVIWNLLTGFRAFRSHNSLNRQFESDRNNFLWTRTF